MKQFLKNHFKKNINLYILILITAVGACLRFYNLNWDSGHFFPPDERNIDMAVSRISFFNQLDPGFFAYGGFLIYLYKLGSQIIFFLTKNSAWLYDWGKLNLVGRFFSALFAVTAIPVIFSISKKLFNTKVAFLSGILTVFTVSLIQSAHFSTTESALVFFSTVICLLSIIALNNSSFKNYALIGILLGISSATKITAVAFVVFLLAVHITVIFKKKHFLRKNLYFFISLLLGFIIFAIFSPYTFLSWNKFMESMNYESSVAIGTLPVVYTLQFDKTLPYLFQLKNLFWQMGPVALLAIIGFIILFVKMLLQKNAKLFVFLSFPLSYFAYIGVWHAKFIRYMEPLLPFLIIAASYLLISISRKFKNIGWGLVFSLTLITILWALAFFSIYTRPQTRISASVWIYKNIPPNSKILTEQWDDGLPVPVDNFNPGIYQTTSLAMYDTDNQAKINYLAQNLSQADYIIFNSRRLYATLIRLTGKYPITSKYYKLLFAGKLGYVKVAQFTSYPSILGLQINDDLSEETFQVYDHPKVIIFKNIKYFPDYILSKMLNI